MAAAIVRLGARPVATVALNLDGVAIVFQSNFALC